VLHSACATAATWPEPLTISVNLSPAQFGEALIVNTVADALRATGLRPGRLQLEITESLLLRDTEAVMRELAELKALGATIVMDDFGTGYSSLSYLWRFPFDKLKIDASFMRAVETGDASADKIVRAIAALGRSLDMTVCVEGVETKHQADFVDTVDCDEAQGYYFGRPAPAADVAAIVLADFNARLPTSATATRHAGVMRAG
jgi:EAL domain-containing protein (putative c-di-GMP-specific phosphodiesterase class I)